MSWELGGVLVVGFTSVSIITDGFSGRLSERSKELFAGAFDTEHFQFCPKNSFDNACQLGLIENPVRLVVIGDSHTPMLHQPMGTIAEMMGARGILWWHSACPLLDGAWRENDGYRDTCLAFKERVFSELQSLPNLDTVVLVGSWAGQLSLTGDRVSHPFMDHESLDTSKAEAFQAFRRSMRRTLAKLNELHVNVIVLGSSPGAGFDVPRILALADLNRIDRPFTVSTSSVREVQMQVDGLIRSVTNDFEHVSYVPIWDLFCPSESCSITIGNTPIYSDGAHLSGRGVTEFLGPALIQRVNAALVLLQ